MESVTPVKHGKMVSVISKLPHIGAALLLGLAALLIFRAISPPAVTSNTYLAGPLTSTYMAMHCQTPDICGPNQLDLYQVEVVPMRSAFGSHPTRTVVTFKVAPNAVQACPSWQLPQNAVANYSPPNGLDIITASGNKNLPTVQSCDIAFWWNGDN